MTDTESSYDPTYFAALAQVERRHFWFRGRNAVIGGLARQITQGLPDGFCVLEVGCGTGNVLRALREACPRGRIYGLDLHRQGLEFASREDGAALVQGDAHHAPFEPGFDLVGLFDVLEHLQDERAVLRDLRGLLKPGGALLLTVPANPALWSYFDEAAHHVRRYQPANLCARLEENGFQVEFLSPYIMATYPVMRLGRWLAARTSGYRPGGSAEKERGLVERELTITPGVNDILGLILRAEAAWVARRRRLPFGSSLVALARAA